jgi:IclR family transcriptional regulator, acetate operon repressor
MLRPSSTSISRGNLGLTPAGSAIGATAELRLPVQFATGNRAITGAWNTLVKKSRKRQTSSDPAQSIAGTRAIRRTCMVLREIAGASNSGASLQQLVAATSMPKSSVHRYLEVLVQEQFLERDARAGTYRLGASFITLASNEGQLLVLRARPYLERLRDRFDETVNIGTLSGDNIVYLDIIESPRAVRLAARIGDRDMIHSTALGKAIAAQLPESEVIPLLQRTGLPRRTASTITRIPELTKHLELVRRNGFALDNQENDVEGRCVALSMPAPWTKYAISISGITSRFPMSKTIDAAREIRQAISELTGQSVPPVKPYG